MKFIGFGHGCAGDKTMSTESANETFQIIILDG